MREAMLFEPPGHGRADGAPEGDAAAVLEGRDEPVGGWAIVATHRGERRWRGSVGGEACGTVTAGAAQAAAGAARSRGAGQGGGAIHAHAGGRLGRVEGAL